MLTVSLNQDCPLPFLSNHSWKGFKEPAQILILVFLKTINSDDWTLPHRTGVISLVAHRSVEDHQMSAVHQHRHLSLLCRWQAGQDHRLVDVMDPDQFGATVIILEGRTLQGHHLTRLNMYICGSPRTHTCKWKVIWFYISELDTKTPQIICILGHLCCWIQAL